MSEPQENTPEIDDEAVGDAPDTDEAADAAEVVDGDANDEG